MGQCCKAPPTPPRALDSPGRTGPAASKATLLAQLRHSESRAIRSSTVPGENGLVTNGYVITLYIDASGTRLVTARWPPQLR